MARTLRRKTIPRNAKPERNRQIYDLARNHPELTLEQIGNMYKIGRSRVCAIINRIELDEANK